MKKLRVLGIANGQGVGLFAFKRHHILGNIEPRNEYFSPNNEQWKENFPQIPIWKNLNGIPIDKMSDFISNGVDVIIGNPKCGGSSSLRFSRAKKLSQKKDEPTLELFLYSIHHFQPEVFLLENLTKLLQVHPKEEFEDRLRTYDLIFHSCSVSKFGNSQISRERLIIIGVKKKSSRFSIKQFTKIFKVRRLKSTSELLEGLILNENGHIIEPKTKILSMYDYRVPERVNLNVAQIQKLWTKDFKDEYKWPIKSKKMWTLPGVYRNKDNSYPMTARKADRQFLENGLPMSPRQLARIMGIPDRFKIYTEEGPKRQYFINKGRLSVTQTFPYEIAIWFRECLKKS